MPTIFHTGSLELSFSDIQVSRLSGASSSIGVAYLGVVDSFLSEDHFGVIISIDIVPLLLLSFSFPLLFVVSYL